MLKLKYNLYSVTLILFLLFSFSSCYYDKEELLYADTGMDADCDTTIVSYSENIKPIIELRCYPCHGSSPETGASKYTTYNLLKIYLDGNKSVFENSINHSGTANAMPQDQPKLPACEIRKLSIWISKGYPNN